jgi:hypothetical protein
MRATIADGKIVSKLGSQSYNFDGLIQKSCANSQSRSLQRKPLVDQEWLQRVAIAQAERIPTEFRSHQLTANPRYPLTQKLERLAANSRSRSQG